MKNALGKLVGGLRGNKEEPALRWQPANETYPRLKDFNAAGLRGQGGVYAIWHLGVRPQWLRVGATTDLGAALAALVEAPWVKTHEGNAGIYVATALNTSDQALGYARYLAEKLRPAFQREPFPLDRALDKDAVPCPLPPGTQT